MPTLPIQCDLIIQVTMDFDFFIAFINNQAVEKEINKYEYLQEINVSHKIIV